MKTILAIDPGGTTGIALRTKDGQLHTTTTKTMEELHEVLNWPGIEQVVFEGFAAETISRHGLYTVQLVGMIKGVCLQLGISSKVQMPSYRRPFLHKAKEALEGRRVVVHEIDACAHLLRYEHDTRM